MASPAAIASSGLIALAVAMGIGRFAFTPLLPMMQGDGLSLEHGGWLATANYVGYLAGALWAAAHPVRSDRAIRLALAAIGVTTLAMGLVQGFAAWGLLRAAAGVASAWALVHVSSWALARLQAPLLMSLVYSGVGAGIAFAGLACLLLMGLGSSSGAAWLVLGVVALAASAAIWRQFSAHESPRPAAAGRLWRRDSAVLVLCYGAFGFGYIIPATFLPAMAKAIVPDPALFGWAWPVFGAAAALSTLAAAPLTALAGNRRVWIGSHLIMAPGVAAPLFIPGIGGVLVSAVCVGGTFVVATMAGLKEARALAGADAARLMAAMTASFAAGQVVGPAAASLWLRLGGSLDGVLWAAVALLVVSALVLLATGGARR